MCTDDASTDRRKPSSDHGRTGGALAGAGRARRLGQDHSSPSGGSRFGPPFAGLSQRAGSPAAPDRGAGSGGPDRGGAGLATRRPGRIPGPLRKAVRHQQLRLRFLTEGVLTRQLLGDPFLETVGAVVLDEFHERNLNTDLALALVNEVRSQVRPDLIVVVMSATLDAEPVARFLGGCPVIAVEGRAYPVSVEYRPELGRPAPMRSHPSFRSCWRARKAPGHILVFLPGLAEIRRLAKKLEPIADRADAVVLPLHGSLPAEDQDRALRPSERRKVVLSTNVAETSVTIDGVTVVVDSGLARTVHYDPERGIDRWELKRISRAAADQRAGRAGRTGPGRCIRLWSDREQRGLDCIRATGNPPR